LLKILAEILGQSLKITVLSQFNEYRHIPIFPSLPPRTPPQLAPSATDLLAPWHGDLVHDTSISLVILLQRGQIEDGGHELIFQAIYEGLSRDQF
jgi:hypothetical protein